MSQSLSHSNFVRERVIDTAVRLMVKAGCDVTEDVDGNWTTLTVHNPPDPADIHGERLRAAIEA